MKQEVSPCEGRYTRADRRTTATAVERRTIGPQLPRLTWDLAPADGHRLLGL